MEADLLQGLSMALGSPVDPAALNTGMDGLDEEEDLDKPLASRKGAKVLIQYSYSTVQYISRLMSARMPSWTFR